ncbi:hypothetical protein B0H65DRAFT_577199 [Neurospora tetraspora]|uniref:Uncharacterized protein n=1 Tax=Neurospora tetraspora TaxID=94610 RepID=A0AAE0JDL2_9PEZI|nr:hypothetical protein B0H65DRAFT_577199 [Neurospora tetraspora]
MTKSQFLLQQNNPITTKYQPHLDHSTSKPNFYHTVLHCTEPIYPDRMSNIFFWLPMEDQAKVYSMMWPGNWKKSSSSSPSQSKDASGSGQKKEDNSNSSSTSGSGDWKMEVKVETVEYKGSSGK